ncbi:MAG: hypothetical protein ACK2U1_08695 [Anaerolineales bacterium]
MINTKRKLTLDQPAAYHIRVPGILGNRWSDWDWEIETQVDGLAFAFADGPLGSLPLAMIFH